jgi:hypothetical protein
MKLTSANFLAGDYHRIIIIDLKSYQIVRRLETDELVLSLNFDADKNVMYCASAEYGWFKMWQF